MKTKPQPNTTTDERLLTTARNLPDNEGQDIVGGILSRYVKDKRYRHVAKGILHSEEDAEDAVSDAILLALRKWRQFRGESRFSTWFTRIVITCSLMARRARKQSDAGTPMQERWIPQQLDDMVYQQEIRGLLRDAIAELECPKEKAILTMRVDEGIPFKDVAKRLNTPLGTVKNIALSAYAHLEEELINLD